MTEKKSELEKKPELKIEDHPLLNVELLENEVAGQQARFDSMELTDDNRKQYWDYYEALEGWSRLLAYVKHLYANPDEFNELKKDREMLEWKLRFNLMNQTG